ncbi:MAG: CoA-binding protein [Pirellulales bacterium]
MAKSQPTVAILGASEDRRKFGNKSLRAHVACGYTAYPVNPRGGTIEGLTAYPSLADVPGTLDRISVYLTPSRTLAALDEIAAKGCRQLWLNPGTTDAEVRARAAELGLNAIEGCSIVDLGVSPGAFPDE